MGLAMKRTGTTQAGLTLTLLVAALVTGLGTVSFRQEPEGNSGQHGIETWISPDGRSLEGRFVKLDWNQLELQKPDGQTVRFSVRHLSPESAARARELAGVTGDSLPASEIRRVEKELIAPDLILPLYRRRLADERLTEQEVAEALEQVKLLETAERRGQWLIDGQFVVKEETHRLRTKSMDKIREAIGFLEANNVQSALSKLKGASTGDPVSPLPLMVEGLISALIERRPVDASRSFREAARRAKQYRSILDADCEQIGIAAQSNLALSLIYEGKPDEALKVWLAMRESSIEPTAEIRHNVFHAIEYARLGKTSPNDDFFKSYGKRILNSEELLLEWCKTNEVTPTRFWRYMWVAPSEGLSDVSVPWSNPEALLDRGCLGCNGSGKRDCRNCADGLIVVRFPKVIVLPNGKRTTVEGMEKRPCNVCSGKARLDCPHCSNGTEEVLFGGR